jgi:high potential iron-sulfur protein
MKNGRRQFLHVVPIAFAGLALGARAQTKPPAGGGKLDENDPQAKALGYVHDAKKADKAKFPNWKEGEVCDNCVQFKGKPKDAFGPCQIFQNKQVAGKGWCSAWQKKA